MKKNKKLAIIFFSLFIILVIFIKLGLTKTIDNSFYNLTQIIANDNVTKIFKGITFLASPLCLIGFLIIIILLSKDKGLLLLIKMLINQLLNEILKRIIRRPRPNVNSYITEKGFSCPSGHAMGSLIFYGTIIIFIWHSKINKKLKILITTILSILIILIGLSRIYLGVHYLSDILAGFFLSMGILISFQEYVNQK